MKVKVYIGSVETQYNELGLYSTRTSSCSAQRTCGMDRRELDHDRPIQVYFFCEKLHR